MILSHRVSDCSPYKHPRDLYEDIRIFSACELATIAIIQTTASPDISRGQTGCTGERNRV